MCGIAGCVLPEGRTPSRAALERMADALDHRGPDDRGIVVSGTVGLVHTRLSIVDPSPAGHQPMADASGRWLLTYNGEIYNHAALRAELPPVDYRGGTDTETLLQALVALGEEAIPRCDGLYAYAALDTRARRLLLVRDRFGIKPLYIARHDGGLWFASEARALLAAGVPARPDRELVRHALATGWVNGPLTPLEGIGRVMPGTVVSVDLDTLQTSERTWYAPTHDVDPERMAALARLDRHGAAEAFEQALRTSVQRQLMADVPVGTMCSGGFDSSLVTAFAKEVQPETAVFHASIVDQPEADERPYAEAVARHLGIEMHTVETTAASWRADLVDVVRHVEYPLTHESSVPMTQIAALARDAGVKALLSGEGADELFGGYSWVQLEDHADFAARRNPAIAATRWAYRRLQGLGIAPAPSTAAIDRPGTARAVSEIELELRARGRAAYRHHRGVRGRLEGGLLADLSIYLPHLLNRQDKTTMRVSIETRVPFLDPDLVALALNLPLERRIEPDRKQPLRDVGRRYLPPEVTERGQKVGFGFDVGRYITPAARPEFLLDGQLRELFEAPAEAWADMVGQASRQHALLLWTAEIWHRTVVDGQSTDAVNAALWKDPDRDLAPVRRLSGARP